MFLVSSSNRTCDNLFIPGDLTAQLSWQSYLSSDNNVVSKAKFNISTGGIYYVYCHLRVGKPVNRVVIRTSSSELFSTLPAFTSNGTDVMRMSGLAKIPSYALLYVEIEFDKSVLKDKDTLQSMDKLFPDYFEKEKSPNSFGMFLVS